VDTACAVPVPADDLVQVVERGVAIKLERRQGRFGL